MDFIIVVMHDNYYMFMHSLNYYVFYTQKESSDNKKQMQTVWITDYCMFSVFLLFFYVTL